MQEALRAQVLAQPSSIFTELGGRVALSASLPSGKAPVLAARSEISGLLSDAGMLPSIDCDAKCHCPSVHHLKDGACRFRPDSLFVGAVEQIIDISPWSLPLPCTSFLENTLFMQSRADLRVLLLHLRDKVLVCSCHSPPSQCWAFFLQMLFCEIFDVELAHEYSPNCGSRRESDDVGCESEDNEYKPRQSDLAASGKEAGAKASTATVGPRWLLMR